MRMQPPAEVGMPLESVDTPALLVDLDRFDRNLKTMSDSLLDTKVRLRPHAKTHKSPIIALRQMEFGAVGVCCQKVGEAEAMVEGGVPDVFVSNEIVGKSKLERLVSLAKQARIAICADDSFHVLEYGAAAKANGAELDVFVELDVGGARCGLGSEEPVLRLARQIAETPGLRFAGLQAYHGAAQHLRTFVEREAAIRSAANQVLKTKSVVEENGIVCKTVTGAGTGTYPLEAASGIYDEVQPGSYIFMDVDYAKNLDADGEPVKSFRHGLFVYSTIISRPTRDRAVLDAGHKAVPIDSGLPQVSGIPDVEYTRPSDEHGTLVVKNPDCDLKIGDKVMLIPAHCDPTVNLFDWYVGIRNNHVEVLWPITARGAMR